LKDVKKISKGGIKNICDGIYDIMNAITSSSDLKTCESTFKEGKAWVANVKKSFTTKKGWMNGVWNEV